MGLAGVVVPVLPGLLLVWGGVALWAIERQDTTAWVTLALASAALVIGSVVKYLIPGRRLRDRGVPWRTLALGALLGFIGFFVIPVVGLFVGFVLGIYLAEYARLNDTEAAWTSTKHALVAVGWSILIELAAGLIAAAIWVTGATIA